MARIRRIGGSRRLVVARPIESPADRVWEVFRDTTLWPEWGPSVRAVDCPVRFIEPGTTGRIRIPGGLWVPFEITTCRDNRWTWSVAKIPATGHSVEPIAADQCRARFDMPLAATGYAPVCRRALDRIASLAER